MTLVGYKTKDNAQSTLLGNISSSATSMIVQSGEGAKFPSVFPYFLTLEKFTVDEQGEETITKSEQIKVTDRTSDAFVIERGQNGTTAQSFDADDRVSLYMVSKIIEDIQEAITAVENGKLAASGGLRGGMTASKLLYINSSGNEAYLGLGTSSQYLKGDLTWGSPPLDINGQSTASGIDKASDFMAIHDTSAGGVRKILLNTLVPDATTGLKGLVERATDIEAAAGVDTTRYITPKQVKDNFTIKTSLIQHDFYMNDQSQSAVTVAHGLGKIPRLMICRLSNGNSFGSHGGFATYDGTTINQKAYDSQDDRRENVFVHREADSSDEAKRFITSIDDTNVTFSFSYSSSFSAFTLSSIITFIG